MKASGLSSEVGLRVCSGSIGGFDPCRIRSTNRAELLVNPRRDGASGSGEPSRERRSVIRASCDRPPRSPCAPRSAGSALGGVSLGVSLGRQLQAALVSQRGARTAEPCEMSARVSPCQFAPGPCHAEGRGFEPLRPLQNPRKAGVFVCGHGDVSPRCVPTTWLQTASWHGTPLRRRTSRAARKAKTKLRELSLRRGCLRTTPRRTCCLSRPLNHGVVGYTAVHPGRTVGRCSCSSSIPAHAGPAFDPRGRHGYLSSLGCASVVPRSLRPLGRALACDAGGRGFRPPSLPYARFAGET